VASSSHPASCRVSARIGIGEKSRLLYMPRAKSTAVSVRQGDKRDASHREGIDSTTIRGLTARPAGWSHEKVKVNLPWGGNPNAMGAGISER
jgi:hypothetical protein